MASAIRAVLRKRRESLGAPYCRSGSPTLDGWRRLSRGRLSMSASPRGAEVRGCSSVLGDPGREDRSSRLGGRSPRLASKRGGRSGFGSGSSPVNAARRERLTFPFGATSVIMTVISSPILTTSSTRATRMDGSSESSEIWTRPSLPGRISRRSVRHDAHDSPGVDISSFETKFLK